MKKVLTVAVLSVAFVASSFANEGEQIFKSKGCVACHKATVNTVGPSLKKIASAYAGKEADLVAYLKGNHPAIVDPKKAIMMKSQLNKLKSLSEDKIKALADYILSNK